MNISEKIGITVVTLESREPDLRFFERMGRKRPPLTPDLFPYYAGSLADYDDGYYNVEGEYDEIYQDELEVLNQHSFEDINKISKIVEESEIEEKPSDRKDVMTNNIENISTNKTSKIIESSDEYLSKQLDAFDSASNDVHVNSFNDVIKQEQNKKDDAVESFSVSEPVNEKQIELSAESTKPQTNDESINGNQAKFVVKANAKNKYYEDVLDTVNNLFETK